VSTSMTIAAFRTVVRRPRRAPLWLLLLAFACTGDAATSTRDRGAARPAPAPAPGVDDAATRASIDARRRAVRDAPAEPAGVRLGAELAPAPALVREVIPDSPAAAAGLKPGDTILQIDRQPVHSAGDVLLAAKQLMPGRHEFTVRRGTRSITLRLELPANPPTDRPRIGVSFMNGVLIRSVEPDSPVHQGGLRAGDIVIQSNGADATDPAELASQIEKIAGNSYGWIALDLNRDGNAVRLTLTQKTMGVPSGKWKHLPLSDPRSQEMLGDAFAREERRTPASPLDGLTQCNLLQLALVDPATGRLVLVGRYDPAYPSGPIPYHKLLADALENPYPVFSLESPGLGDPTLSRIRSTFDQEFARISRDTAYGIEWMKGLLLPILTTRDGDSEERRTLDARLHAAGTNLESYDAYMKWQDGKFTDESFYTGARAYLGAVFQSEVGDANAGFCAAAHRRAGSQPTRANFESWAASAGCLGAMRRMDQEIQNGRNQDEANRDLVAEVYTAMLRMLGAPEQELLRLAAAHRAGTVGEDAFLELQAPLMNNALTNFLSRKVVNGMTFSGASLSGRYQFPPIRSALNTFGARRESPLMRVFFNADYTLKFLAASSRAAGEVPEHVTSQVFLGEAENRAGAAAGRTPQTGLIRHWIQPESVHIDVLPGNAGLRFGDAALRVSSEPLEVQGGDNRGNAFFRRALADYGEHVTKHLDAYARVYPSLHVLRETAKVIALARWVRSAGIRLEPLASDSSGPALPAQAEGFWGMTCLVRPSGETDTLVVWAQGGVTFDQKSGESWIQTTPPSAAVAKDTLQQLAASTALGEKAVAALERGEFEAARAFAEQSAQAMTGQLDLSRLPEPVPMPVDGRAINLAEQAGRAQSLALGAASAAESLRVVRDARAVNAQWKETDPQRYAQSEESNRKIEALTEDNLRRLHEHLRAYREAFGLAPPSAVDLAHLVPGQNGTVYLPRPAAPRQSAPAVAALEKRTPTAAELRVELARLRSELEVLKTSLGRLNRSIQMDQEQFSVWEAEAAGAIERANERAKEFVKEKLQDAFLGWAEHYFKEVQPSPERLSDIKNARDVMDLYDFDEWANRKDEGLERVADGVRLLADKLPIADKLKDLIQAVDSSIESAFDISAWIASWKRLGQLDKNSMAFLEAVARSSERMRTIVERIKEIERRLAAIPPPTTDGR
jgi:hypothetical protein